MIFNKKLLMVIAGFLILSVVTFKLYLNSQYGGYNLLDRCKSYNLKVHELKEYRGVLFVNDSLTLATSYKNTNPPIMLYKFIKEGDSLELKARRDTLFLYRGNEKHWFIYYGDKCNMGSH